MTKTLTPTLAGLLLATASLLAQAGTLAIQPATSNVNLGDDFTIDVVGTGFAQQIVGGGFNLSFDPTVLQFDPSPLVSAIAPGWEFAPSLGSEQVVSPTLHTLTDISFASFVISPTGNFTVATLGFKAIGTAINSPLTLAPSAVFDFSNKAGGAVVPVFGSALVNVSGVPEPSGGALLLAGLLTIG
jgi:hypothetical protein